MFRDFKVIFRDVSRKRFVANRKGFHGLTGTIPRRVATIALSRLADCQERNPILKIVINNNRMVAVKNREIL
jgi:hypothetical protein